MPRIDVKRIGQSCKVVRQQVSLGHAQHQRAVCLRHRAAIRKRRIAEVRVPVKIVVNGVIDSAIVFSAITYIQTGDAQVIEECRII